LLVRIGLDHEPWLGRALRSARNPRLAPRGPGDLDVSQGIALLQAETVRARPERGGHVHGLGNPHYWLAPQNPPGLTATIPGGRARAPRAAGTSTGSAIPTTGSIPRTRASSPRPSWAGSRGSPPRSTRCSPPIALASWS